MIMNIVKTVLSFPFKVVHKLFAYTFFTILFSALVLAILISVVYVVLIVVALIAVYAVTRLFLAMAQGVDSEYKKNSPTLAEVLKELGDKSANTVGTRGRDLYEAARKNSG